MRDFARKAVVFLVPAIVVLLAGCGGGGNSGGGGGGNQNPTTPTVSVTPASNSIPVGQGLQVNVTVTGTSSTPTGTVTLSSGTYSSTATALSSGSASITIPAGSLAAGSNTIKASYTPDSASSSKYNNANASATVTVTVATPTVTVTPVSLSIGTGQPLGVTVTVAGFSGGPVPTGSVTLTGANGSYSSGAKVLAAGSATITVPGGTLAAGSAKLTASYTPDTAGSADYASASGSATVTVTSQLTPTVTVTPASQSLATSSSLSVAVSVTGTGATPTGSIVLSSGSYNSAAETLTAGSATIVIPAYSLVFGSDTLSAAYTPDSAGSATYTSATGTSAPISVAKATPTVTVTPASLSINTAQSLGVTITVSGGASAPAATGTISVTGGGYTSPPPPATALSNGSATISIPAGALAAGSDTLTATYTPDTAGSTLFKPATGTSAAITVITMSTVTVNQSTTLAPVTNQLLGMNLANWYDVVGNAIPINTAFGKAGIKAIRWPGGSWSDVWHWRTSPTNLLPYNCNDPGPRTSWGGYSPFADFVTSIAKGGNYDLALTANYGSNAACNGGGDPTEAAGWVAEAVSEGYAPSHVTVGNENYGSWEFDLHTKQWDPTTYANSVIGASGYYQLIKNASPNTLVGVVVDAGIAGGNGLANWDPIVLANAKYDFIEYHYYPQYGSVTNDNYLVYQAALDFTTNIKTIKSELTAAGNTSSIPIYVGELGGNSANPGTQSWSITQGLYAGQILGEAMNDGISRLTWWIGFGNCLGNAGSGPNPNNNNSNPSLYGWQNTWGALSIFSDIDPNCPGAGPIGTMSPTAQAFNLFQNLATSGASALSTTVNGDPTNIRAYTAAQSDGSNILFLFNLNENQSLPVTVSLSKQSASSDVSVITYDKSIYDQTNPAINPTPVWAAPTSKDYGAKSLPMTLTLTPWSMNVVILK